MCGMSVKTRVIVQFDEPQLKQLQKEREKTGASYAEILRRALALYLSKRNGR